MSVVEVKRVEELLEHIADWEDLAAAAIEPNPFYEPWMLMPAIESFGAGRDLRFILVFSASRANPNERPLLCGFFPLERGRRYKGLPITALSLWQHLHCFLCTPLVREGCGRQCLDALFGWLASESEGCSLMQFNRITGEGPFHRLLVEQFDRSARLTYIDEHFARPLFEPAADASAYLQATLSAKRRKKIRRQENQLSERGRLEYVALQPEEDVGAWIEEFLSIEASGWKGKQNSALASNDAERRFFAAAARAAFLRGRLMMLAMRLDGKPIAHQCNFRAGDGSFAFKVAFDEDYSRFSPGVLLEIENIHYLHANPDVRWMDSCCCRSGTHMDGLWGARRTILSVAVSTGNRIGDFAVSVLPLMRWAKRLLPKSKGEGREMSHEGNE